VRATYAAAGEYDGGAKVWMLLELPNQISVSRLTQTLHLSWLEPATMAAVQSSSSQSLNGYGATIKSIRYSVTGNQFTYTLKHTASSKLQVSEIKSHSYLVLCKH
jgi:hypothetical protein